MSPDSTEQPTWQWVGDIGDPADPIHNEQLRQVVEMIEAGALRVLDVPWDGVYLDREMAMSLVNAQVPKAEFDCSDTDVGPAFGGWCVEDLGATDQEERPCSVVLPGVVVGEVHISASMDLRVEGVVDCLILRSSGGPCRLDVVGSVGSVRVLGEWDRIAVYGALDELVVQAPLRSISGLGWIGSLHARSTVGSRGDDVGDWVGHVAATALGDVRFDEVVGSVDIGGCRSLTMTAGVSRFVDISDVAESLDVQCAIGFGGDDDWPDDRQVRLSVGGVDGVVRFGELAKVAGGVVIGTCRRLKMESFAAVDGDFMIESVLEGEVRGVFGGDVEVRTGRGHRGLEIDARIGHDLIVGCHEPWLNGAGVGEEELVSIRGEVGGSILIDVRETESRCDLHCSANVRGDVSVGVLSTVEVEGRIGGSLTVGSRRLSLPLSRWEQAKLAAWADEVAEARALASARQSGATWNDSMRSLHIQASVGGRVDVLAPASEGISLCGEFFDEVELNPPEPTAVVSLRFARFSARVLVGENISIESCDFRGVAGLEHFDLLGADQVRAPIRALRDKAGGMSWREAADVNRRLRVGLECRGNRPSARVFYRGEMDARLAGASALSLERFLLGGYKWLSSYGQSAARPLAWLALIWMLASYGFAHGGLDLNPESSSVPQDASLAESAVFTVKSLVGFWNPPEAELGPAGATMQLGLRFVGPLLITQALLAVRDRVAR